MAEVNVNGITLSYTTHGEGEPVLLVAPAASKAAMWDLHQVPALRAAGYQVITFDNRGSAPSSVPPGPYRVAELVSDTAGLIRALGIGPCRIVGASLGAMTAQELALVRPDLVRSLVLMATRGRNDLFRDVLAEVNAHAVRHHESIPGKYAAVSTAVQLFSRRTLMDDKAAADWLDILTAFPQRGEGPAGQYEATRIGNRLDAYTAMERPAMVIGFTEDSITPPAFGREVADAIPGGRYVEFDNCGHYGFLERPDDVNRAIREFLAADTPAMTAG